MENVKGAIVRNRELMEGLLRYFETTGRQQVEADWSEFAHYDGISPGVDELLSKPSEVSTNTLTGKMIETGRKVQAYFRNEITLDQLNQSGIYFA